MTSDFFLEEADEWREAAWELMRERSDVRFFLLTKRPQRIWNCLPKDWGDGWENIFFNVTCENQRRADERIPLLLELPFKHKGIMCAPFIGAVSIEKYLGDGQIEQVICGGENYDGARPCHFDWVKHLRAECVAHDITFCFIETGTVFVKDNKRYYLPKKQIQSEMAYKSGMNYAGKPIEWKLTDRFSMDIPKEDEYADYTVQEIAEKFIEGTPEVKRSAVHPDHPDKKDDSELMSGDDKVEGLPTVDKSQRDGTVYYDIRFLSAAFTMRRE